MRSHRVLTVLLALGSVVAAACGASPRVEREVAARAASPLSAGRAVNSDTLAGASAANGVDNTPAAGTDAGAATGGAGSAASTGSSAGNASSSTGPAAAAGPRPPRG